MFWRITGKLLLKAIVPMLILVGILNYSMAVRGGDPIAHWKGIAENALASVQNGASNAASSLNGVKDDLLSVDLAATSLDSSNTKVYSWKDEHGMMHYSTSKPAGIEAQSQTYDSQANIVQAFKAPEKPERTVQNELVNKTTQSPTPASTGLTLPAGAEALPDIEGLDLKQLDNILKERQQMLDKL